MQVLSADGERRRGKCPLTPHEVGLMLQALGFANDTYLYVASGEIYGGEETLRPLRELFPNFYMKEMLANDLSPIIMEIWPRFLQVEGEKSSYFLYHTSNTVPCLAYVC